jgi:hypothetical protein
MNHDFIGHPSNAEKCIECGYPENKHGDNAVCDCCEKVGNLRIFGKGNQMMLLTVECMEREKAILEQQIKDAEAHQAPEKQAQRLAEYKAVASPYEQLIKEAKKIDEQLHLNSDIFTAKTVSIEEVRRAIWANDEIPQDKKFFEYVAFCKNRIATLQSVIFDLDKQKIEVYSEQKAWHISMNEYANKLRGDERAQLRIQDNTYDVKMPKTVTPTKIKTKIATKEDKFALRKAVAELNSELFGTGKDGLSEVTITHVMVSKNWTIEQACNHFRRSFKEGRSEATPVETKKEDGI